MLWQPLATKTNNNTSNKSCSRISSGDHKRTQQEVSAVLLPYIYYYMQSILRIIKPTLMSMLHPYICCSNHLPEQHLQYAYFSKAHRRLSSSGDYKKTRQGALTALLSYLYKLQVVYATTICLPHVYSALTVQDCASCPNVHVSYMWQQCGIYAS